MGIKGLFKLVHEAISESHISELKGKIIGIDASMFLYKGAYSCAGKLDADDLQTRKYINYFMKQIKLLQSYKITPVVVFDGAKLPAKANINLRRKLKFDKNRKLAESSLAEGKIEDAADYYRRSLQVTPKMVNEVIKELRIGQVDYIISPFEADAQLCFLAKKGLIDVVLTNDSDLIIYGCPMIFYRIDLMGKGCLFDASKLPLCKALKPNVFSLKALRRMAILSGCDYCDSIKGIGLLRARDIVNFKQKERTVSKIMERLTTRFDYAPNKIPPDYKKTFIDAENVFLHQLVFDPQEKKIVPLTPYPEGKNVEDFPGAGIPLNSTMALDFSLGNLDFTTMEKTSDFTPTLDNKGNTTSGIWIVGKYTDKTKVCLRSPSKRKQDEELNVSSIKRKRNVKVPNVHAMEIDQEDPSELDSKWSLERNKWQGIHAKVMEDEALQDEKQMPSHKFSRIRFKREMLKLKLMKQEEFNKTAEDDQKLQINPKWQVLMDIHNLEEEVGDEVIKQMLAAAGSGRNPSMIIWSKSKRRYEYIKKYMTSKTCQSLKRTCIKTKKFWINATTINPYWQVIDDIHNMKQKIDESEIKRMLDSVGSTLDYKTIHWHITRKQYVKVVNPRKMTNYYCLLNEANKMNKYIDKEIQFKTVLGVLKPLYQVILEISQLKEPIGIDAIRKMLVEAGSRKSPEKFEWHLGAYMYRSRKGRELAPLSNLLSGADAVNNYGAKPLKSTVIIDNAPKLEVVISASKYCISICFFLRKTDVMGKTLEQIWTMLKDNPAMWKAINISKSATSSDWKKVKACLYQKSTAKQTLKFQQMNDTHMFHARTIECDTQDEQTKTAHILFWFLFGSPINNQILVGCTPRGHIDPKEKLFAKILGREGKLNLFKYATIGKDPKNTSDLGYICKPKDFMLIR